MKWGQTYRLDQGWMKEVGERGTQVIVGGKIKGQIPFLNGA